MNSEEFRKAFCEAATEAHKEQKALAVSRHHLIVEAVMQYGKNGNVVLSNLDLKCKERVKLLEELERLPAISHFDSDGKLHLNLTEAKIALE